MKTELKTEQKVAEFGIEDLLGIGLTFVVLGIGLTYGLNVQADVRGDINQTTAPEAYTAAGDSITAVGKLASKQGLIVTVVVAAVVIGILVRYLWVKYS